MVAAAVVEEPSAPPDPMPAAIPDAKPSEPSHVDKVAKEPPAPKAKPKADKPKGPVPKVVAAAKGAKRKADGGELSEALKKGAAVPAGGLGCEKCRFRKKAGCPHCKPDWVQCPYGCAKCRYCPDGCLVCNPNKMDKFLVKKAAGEADDADEAVKAAASAKELDKGAAAEAKGPLESHWEEVLEAEGCFGAAAPGDAEAGEPDELEELEDEDEEGGLDGDAEELLKMAFKPWVPDAD